MEKVNIIYVKDRQKWREWLEKNFETEKEVWFTYPVKASGEASVLYNDAVEEALCFGWIDSTIKHLDPTHRIQRFTPRNPKSTFSQPNIERLKWLGSMGLIHPKIRPSVKKLITSEFVFPKDIMGAINGDETVRGNYEKFSEPYKRIRVAYIDAARDRPDEFKKRLDNFICKTRENKLITGYGGIDKYYKTRENMISSILIHPEELTKKWIERAKRLGYDALALHPRGGKRAHETLAEMLGWLKTPEYCSLIDYAKSIGLKIEYEFHAMGYLLPRELFSAHPEYFRMNDNGERTPDSNFCVSNANAMKIVKENAKALAEALYGSTDNFYFWADDLRGATCQCEKCRKLTPSDKNLIIMNEMLSAVREAIPTAKMAYLAYQDTLDAPTNIKPAEGIFLEYAPIDRDMTRPYAEQGEGVAPSIEKLVSFFGKSGSKVLEYWMDNSMFSNWQKPPKKYEPRRDVIASDLKFYGSLGFERVSSFACFLGDDYEALYGQPDIVSL